MYRFIFILTRQVLEMKKSHRLSLMVSCISFCMPMILFAEGKVKTSTNPLHQAFEQAKEDLEKQGVKPTRQAYSDEIEPQLVGEETVEVPQDGLDPVDQNYATPRDSERAAPLSPSERDSNAYRQDGREPSQEYYGERSYTDEPSMDCCQQEVCQPVVKECCYPCSRSEYGFYIMGEWLYWKFSEGGSEYAVNYNEVLPGELQQAHSDKTTFDWKSGFRVGAGYLFEDNDWDLYAAYTEVRPHTNETTNATVFPLLYYQDTLPVRAATSANVNWNIDFKTLDVLLGQRYCVTDTLSLHPNVGLKAAWIDQRASVVYENTNPAFGGIPVGGSITLNQTNDFRGVGLEAGLDSLWYMGQGLSLYGRVSGALLVSEFSLHQTQDQVTDVGTIQQIDLRGKFHVIAPTAKLSLGVDWKRGFRCDQLFLHLNIGFETQYWWNQNRLARFTSVTVPVYVRNSEDLGMYGLTLGAGLDF